MYYLWPAIPISQANMKSNIEFSKKLKNTARTTITGKIIVASNLKHVLTKNQLQAIILHEKGHIKHRHHLKNLIRLLLIYGFFVTPDYLRLEEEADCCVVDQGYGHHLIEALSRIKTIKNSMMYIHRISSIKEYMKIKRI